MSEYRLLGLLFTSTIVESVLGEKVKAEQLTDPKSLNGNTQDICIAIHGSVACAGDKDGVQLQALLLADVPTTSHTLHLKSGVYIFYPTKALLDTTMRELCLLVTRKVISAGLLNK